MRGEINKSASITNNKDIQTAANGDKSNYVGAAGKSPPMAYYTHFTVFNLIAKEIGSRPRFIIHTVTLLGWNILSLNCTALDGLPLLSHHLTVSLRLVY